MKTPTWYPNADDRKCSGSFKTAINPRDRDGKVECGACGRKVGLRNPRTKQLAQHRRPAPPKQDAAPVHVVADIVKLVTGISLERIADAVGDPQKEAGLLREVSDNARRDAHRLDINLMLNLAAGGHRLGLK